jgi:hypothetical protein
LFLPSRQISSDVWILLVQVRDTRDDCKKGSRRGLLERNLSNFLVAFRNVKDVGCSSMAGHNESYCVPGTVRYGWSLQQRVGERERE